MLPLITQILTYKWGDNKHTHFYVRFKVLTAMRVAVTKFGDIAPYSLVAVDRRFRGAHSLHLYRSDDRRSMHL
jgi:hypothetical protein